MTERQAKQFCIRTIRQLAKVFCVDFYTIKIRFRWEKDAKGSNLTMDEYEQSIININLEKADTLDDLRRTCLHEMIHILLARLDRLAWDLAKFYDRDGGKVMKKQTIRAIESTTVHLTRILAPLVFDQE